VKNKIIIISPFRNCEKWIRACTRSVLVQKYDNYEAYFIDDCSSDKTLSILKEELSGKDGVRCIANEDRKYKLASLRDTINSITLDDEDIITILDGDDWYYSDNVLSILNEAYNTNKCLVTYGSYVEHPSGIRGKFSKRLPSEIVKNRAYRDYVWSTSHLFSFKAKLWNGLNEQDFRDASGEYFKFATDVALIFPLLEMAGENIHFIEDPLYVYNTTNPLNEHKVDHVHQLRVERHVRSLAKKEVLI